MRYSDWGDSGNQRGRREAMENIRQKDKLARAERQSASAVRNRLEKHCVSEGRAGLERIVAMATCDSLGKRSLEGTLGGLRLMAQYRKAEAAPADFAGGDDARDEVYVSPLCVGRVRDVGGRMRGGSSTEDGSGDNSDHWPREGGEISDAMDALSLEDVRHILSQRIRSKFW